MKYKSAPYNLTSFMSLPVWGRGLKFMDIRNGKYLNCVAPRVGAWIEIVMATSILGFDGVAPRVGAWIEIR